MTTLRLARQFVGVLLLTAGSYVLPKDQRVRCGWCARSSSNARTGERSAMGH